MIGSKRSENPHQAKIVTGLCNWALQSGQGRRKVGVMDTVRHDGFRRLANGSCALPCTLHVYHELGAVGQTRADFLLACVCVCVCLSI